MADRIKIEILEDGVASITTDAISGKNHMSADQFMEEFKKFMGGEVQTTKTRKGHVHVHVKDGQVIKHSH